MSGGRIRVLYVVGSFVVGGAERHLIELWRRMDREAFDIEIACFRREGPFVAEVEGLGWPLRDLGVGRRIYDPTGWRGLARLVRHTLRFRPDVIHGYLFGPNLFAALAGRVCGVRAVVIAKRNLDAFETSRQVFLQRITHRLATHVTAVSEAVAARSVALGVPRDRVTVIPNGVNVARFADDTRLGSCALDELWPGAHGEPVVGSVGCLAPRKDYATLLEALALVRDRGRSYRAVLVGDGPERGRLEARASALGLGDRVRFLGERTDVERLLPAFDVFVLSSREEGIPNALLEAMAAGRASVATAVGGTPEVLTHGETGWLVPPGSPEALARALDEAFADPGERARRGAAARRAARENLSLDAMTRRHEALYRRLARRGEAT